MIKMIVARSLNGVIGTEGKIPWRLRNDMKFFRQTTEGHTVVMGRKTFESIGKPLPNRNNIVLTRNKDYQVNGVTVVHTPEDISRLPRSGDLFIIGGQQIYEAFMPQADEIYITVVHTTVEGDTHFPELATADWEKMQLQQHAADAHNEYDHTIYKACRRA